MRPLYRTLAVAAAALLAAAGPLLSPRSSFAAGTYLALGDSYAYGYQDIVSTPPFNPFFSSGGSFGDQGYVSRFADFLGQRDGGGRPTVINLARPGETTSTFTNRNTSPVEADVPPFGLTPINFNLNYLPSSFMLSQATLLNATLLTTTPDYITIQLGGNDVLGALFNGESLGPVLTELENNYRAILTDLRAKAPDAEIYLLSYPNPFPGLPVGDSLNTPANQAGIANVAQFTSTLFSILAGEIGAEYVDLTDAFVGQEALLSNIQQLDANGLPNYHPNAAGYQVIGNRLVAAAAVPEAGTAGLLAAGLGGGVLLLAVVRRRRRAAAVPAL